MRFHYNSLGLAVSAIALAGCQLGVEIEVTDNGSRPHFAFSYQGALQSGESVCPRGVTVTEIGGARTLWAIRLVDARTRASCTDRLVYGVAPAGYEVVQPAAALMPGRRYEISASGAGWQEEKTFTLPA